MTAGPVGLLNGGSYWETTPFAVSLMPYSVAWGVRLANGGCYLGLECS
jgi:hypothetical protein